MLRIHWFRRDLRRHDNPALAQADDPVLPVYIHDPAQHIGAPSQWWLHNSLKALEESLGGLLILTGAPEILLPALAQSHGATLVTWCRVGEPAAMARDAGVKSALAAMGVTSRDFPANLLSEPDPHVPIGAGPKVFTPFWRKLRACDIARPSPTAKPTFVPTADGSNLDDLRLCPTRPNWAAGWHDIWQPGEDGALRRLDAFIADGLCGYAKGRDFPAQNHVSKLSAHLHWGELSVRLLWHRILLSGAPQDDIEKFLSEVGWRDFAYRLWHHASDLPTVNWNRSFDRYPWVEDEHAFAAWKTGQTGYPFVDAGMRQLWATGWMHNRARMAAASFLVKHLRIHWTKGAAWFADTLIDADTAVNAASWQWVAGSGADAAPYFRIFNPTLQGEKFDPDGAYVRHWCPDAGARAPIVDHATARAAALDGYRKMRG